MTPEKLMEKAKEAMSHAYAPYSRFLVGAALLCTDGTVYQGCNIENASYGATVCAERVALQKAIYDGVWDFTAIAICGGNGGKLTDICSPCGICRQVLREFCEDNFTIYLTDGKGKIHTYTLAQLLPVSFSTENLE